MKRLTNKVDLFRLPFLGILVVAGISGLMALMALQQPEPVAAYASSLEIECGTSSVTEGESFTLNIANGQENNTETMRVNWYTIPGTAGESDYTSLHGEEQTSTTSQSESGRMGRTFQTTNDSYSEFTESYQVRAINAESNGTGAGVCTINIEDNDGAGAVKTWIDSDPDGETVVSDDGSVLSAYGKGDVIKIKQQFTENVTVEDGSLTLGLHIGTADDYVTRDATYKRGGGTDTLTFEYEVVESDLDPDGIVVPGSDYGGEGSLVTSDGSNTVNTIYAGLTEGMGQTVYGGPYVKKLSVSSTPSSNETYRYGETLEIKAEFDRSVTVDGSPKLRVQIGEGDNDWVDATYSSGSGTDSLYFRYTVVAEDSDSDGISVERGYIDGDGAIQGIAAGGSVTRQSEDYVINPFYDALEDQSSHKVDGKPYATGIAVTSTPASGNTYGIGENIEITVTFDQNLSVDPPLNIPLNIGSGFNTDTYAPSYSSSSRDNLLVFVHRVGNQQRDDDGISISANKKILGDGNLYASGTSVKAHLDIPELPVQEGHQVYAFLPAVSGQSITSTPASGDTYREGETIEVSLTFYIDVEVSGTPTIRILVGDGTGNQRNATYSGGSGTDTLVFAYDVVPSDLDSNGVAIMARVSGGFESGGHVNQKGTTNRSRGRIPGLESQTSHKVDGRPYVTAVAVTSTPAQGGVYRAEETIEVSLTFDQEVDVAETPSIKLKIGESEKDAEYSSGTGTNTLVFEYEVQTADEDADGVSLTAQTSDGFGGSGSIVATGTQVATRESIPGLVNLGGHQVDGQVELVSVSIASEPGDDKTYENGDTIELLAKFSDAVTVTGSPQLAVDVGGVTKIAAYQSDAETDSRTLKFAYTVLAGDEDTDGISIGVDALSLNGGTIVDVAGKATNNSNAAVDNENHLVGAVPPKFSSAETSAGGSEVTITFDEDVDVSSSLRTLSSFAGLDVGIFLRVLFDIFVDDHRIHTTGASISGSELTLSLDTEITEGQDVEVSYDNSFTEDVSDMLVDGAGNALVSFTEETVTNNSTVTANDDTIWPVLSAHSITLTEGSTGTFTVALGSEPDEDVAVSLTVTPAGYLSASPGSLTFTTSNWNTAQTVTLTSSADSRELDLWKEVVLTSDAEDFVTGHVKVLIEDNG